MIAMSSLIADRLRAALRCERPTCDCQQSTGHVHCPAHRDMRHPNLALDARDGTALLRCFAGCSQQAVLTELRRRGLWSPPSRDRRRSTPGARARRQDAVLATYDYTDVAGRLLFQVVRFAPKEFRQRRPNGRGGWVWNLDGVTPSLYRLPDVCAAIAQGQPIYVVEGEKDVEAVRAAGGVATCNPGGAGKWRAAYAESLRGASVIVVQDKDEPGRRHAPQAGNHLRGVATSIRLVEACDGKDASDHLAAGYGLAAFVELPVPQPPDGAALLAAVEQFIRRYVALPSEAAVVAVTLWVAHTHALDSFASTPRLAFLSPEPACGKTRALEVLELLVPHPMLAVTATPAALFRAVANQERRPTVLFDEIDALFGPKAKGSEELRGLLNAGHRRSGVAYRCVGEGTKQEVRAFPAFAAVALAGIGALPDTVLSRSVVIAMRRRGLDERVQPFRQREAETEGYRLRDQLAMWVAGQRSAFNAMPVMPEGLTDRAADVWEPLLAVADTAGGTWPERARAAAVTFVAAQTEQEPSLGVRLLADIREVFERLRREVLPTRELLERLHALEERPWANLHGKPLDAYGLSRRLAGYGVRSKNLRDGATVVKGYRQADFREAWARYLPRPTTDAVASCCARDETGPSSFQHDPATAATAATASRNSVAADPGSSGAVPRRSPPDATPEPSSYAGEDGAVAVVAVVADVQAGEEREGEAISPDVEEEMTWTA